MYPSVAFVYFNVTSYTLGDVFFAWNGVEPEDGNSGLGYNNVASYGEYFGAVTDEWGDF